MSEFQDRQQNIAISVAVHYDGRTVYREASGFADLEKHIPADASMAFSIASITKAFTGAALLKLADDGQIELDAPVQRYVPGFPHHPSGRPVTLRMLAHNLGAVRRWGPERDEALHARRFTDVDEILQLFQNDPWIEEGDPGSRYAYSSYGYNTLGMAIQAASGMPFQRFVTDEILRPLKLDSTRFDHPGLGDDRRPARYSWYDLTDYHELDDMPQRVPDYDYTHNMAGGGMIASVDDLIAFGVAVQKPGLLSSESVDAIWTRPTLDSVESRMSFGWFPTPDASRISINGSNAGVQAGLSVWKEGGLVVAVLANSWGRGSRSGEFMDSTSERLIGRLAAVCGVY